MMPTADKMGEMYGVPSKKPKTYMVFKSEDT